jgi:DNA polymerase-3 subunit epsilon
LPECRSGGDDAAGRAREFNDTLAMMREIVFDTETTGLDPFQGDRMVEIGCIELVNRFPTGKTFHCYFNPERDMPEAAFKVHGLGIDFLKDKPLFAHKVEELTDFLGDAPLVAHNAMFDLGFLNAELERAGGAVVRRERLVDTLMLARRKHPGASNRLDDLCVRYRIDNSRRTKHGALLDAELLAEVYVELIGARQALLGLAEAVNAAGEARTAAVAMHVRPRPLAARGSAEEHAAHREFIAALGENAIWRKYGSGETPDSQAGIG